jgi:hypothetical protein
VRSGLRRMEWSASALDGAIGPIAAITIVTVTLAAGGQSSAGLVVAVGLAACIAGVEEIGGG